MSDVILFFSLFVFGLYAAYKSLVRIRAVSSVPWYVGDSVHFALGVFATRVDVAYAVLISALYLAYQILDDRNPKDVATYIAGIAAGLGGGAVLAS